MEIGEINKKTVVVTLEGDFDISTASIIERKLKSLISQGKVNIVVNLSKVEYIDSSGLATIILIFKETKKDKGTLRLAETPNKILKILELTRLNELLEIYSSEEEALKEIQPDCKK